MSITYFNSVTYLRDAVHCLKEASKNHQNGDVLSIEITHRVGVDVLKHQQEYPLLYWKSKDNDTEYVCWGLSHTLPSLPENSLPDSFPTFAAFAFDQHTPQWPGFHPQLIWTPRWYLEINATSIHLFHLVSSAKKIHLPLGQSPKNDIHLPNKKRWFSHISDLKHIFAKQDLRKLVLSRQSHSKVQNVWDMFRSIVTDHPNCYHFLFSPQPNHVFLGCSPEKLFSVKGNVLHTEALAGTRPRGGKGTDDIKLDKELRHSNKDLNEHHIVTSYILSVLQDHSRNIEVLPQRVLRLKHVQHLQTPIKATLSDDFSLDEILHSLHPTPAVCGYPRKVAQRKIKEMEPFSRGWYSGTIGIIHRGSVDFSVAIRSALAIENDLYIWTGAGIVNNSVASEEWREINIKGKPFFDLAK